ncbi:hypothetical protein ACHAXR_008676 [Thalassiosira sp. AJA248-18]
MATSGYLPILSNTNPVVDNGGDDNGGRSEAAGSDYDDEEGEPPSMSLLFDNGLSAHTTYLPSKPSSIMTVGPTHGHGSRCKIHHGVKFSSRFATMAALIGVCLCQSMRSCSAEYAANDISLMSKEKSAVLTEESPGIRGGIRSPDMLFAPQHSEDENCNYECCVSFIDGLSETGRDFLIVDDERARMLQENTTNNTSGTTENDTSEEGGTGVPVGVQYFLIVILVVFSALFSGLTLGLMSLDPSGLEIVMANSDDPRMARAAKAIYPVRLNGNLLLCTLLLGNVGVNTMLSILMADLTSGLVGFIVSTAVIVIFGEIIPQALCSRFALQVGEKTIPIVKVIMVLLYPLCKPMSMALNKILGHEIGTTYSTSEMAKLIELHVQRGHLEGATGAAMTGALRYRTVSVNEVMTPLANTFLLSADERLGFDTVAKIFKTGYSRIPVYEVSKSNIIGLLFVKDLIFLDPEDEIPVKNFVQIFGRGLHVVWIDDKLGDVLKLLKRGRSHMALVRDVNDGDGKVDPYYEIKGIITLEDIIEIILGDEIIDETDELVDVNDPDSAVVQRYDDEDYIDGALEKSNRPDSHIVGGGVSDRGCSTRAIDWEARLRLLDERLVDEHLSSDEVRAVAAHLKTNFSNSVRLISDRQLTELLALVPVSEISPASTCAMENVGDDGSGVPTDSAELIYERGVPADFCTVVLSGKIMVMSGADKFRSDVSNWGVLASRALTDPSYVPDFSAWVLPNQNSTGGCRCIKLDRTSYCDAVDNTALEKTDHNVHHAQQAVSMTISKESPLALNGNTDTESVCQREGVSSLSLAFEKLAPKKSDSPKQDDNLQQPPTSTLPPQTPGDGVHVEYTSPSYVRSDLQRSRHSRRGKLLKAFTRATSTKK